MDDAKKWAVGMATQGTLPVITFREIDTAELPPKENKRTRKPGEFVEKLKATITPAEIGKATLGNVDIATIDEANKHINRDRNKREENIKS